MDLVTRYIIGLCFFSWLCGCLSYKQLKQFNISMIKIPKWLNRILFLRKDHEVPIVLLVYQSWVLTMIFVLVISRVFMVLTMMIYALKILLYGSFSLLALCFVISDVQQKLRSKKQDNEL